MMKLVEIISTPKTKSSVTTDIKKYVESIGKTGVIVKDSPGFVVNRLLVPFLAEAMKMVDKELASISDIDIAMKLGCGHPMGPLQLADFIGLDVCRNILVGWVEKYPKENFFIPKCLDNLVKANKLGVKTGEGFYNYAKKN